MSNNRNTNKKPARKIIAITVKVGDTVTGKVAKVRHPEPGVLIEIEGQPMAFMPNSTQIGKNPAEKAERRAHLINNPGTEVTVTVMEALDAGYDPANPEKQRLIVNEAKPFIQKREAERANRQAEAAQRAADRASAIADAVAKLVPGTVVPGKVVKLAEKPSTKKEGETFTFGAYVDIGGVSGLLHNREMKDQVAVGESIEVFIISSEMAEGKPRVALSTVKAAEIAETNELLDSVGADMRTTGHDVRQGNVDGVDGFTMKLATFDVPAFLPAVDANVADLSSLTKGSRVARVVTTGEVIGGKYVKVTRKGL